MSRRCYLPKAVTVINTNTEQIKIVSLTVINKVTAKISGDIMVFFKDFSFDFIYIALKHNMDPRCFFFWVCASVD